MGTRPSCQGFSKLLEVGIYSTVILHDTLKGVSFLILLTIGVIYVEKEQMMERILDLERQCKEMSDINESLKIENESFKSTIQKHEEKITDLKRMNMNYFERLTMETKTVKEEPSIVNKNEENPQTWDEFLNQW